jgi:ergothioneine biosynthesis protein EgtB
MAEVPMRNSERYPFAQAFLRARQRTEEILALLRPEAYTMRPIRLRHPFVFYDGHLSAFNWNQLFRRTLGVESFNPDFDARFGRGIDPDPTASPTREDRWPPRDAIQHYKREISQRLADFLERFDPEQPPHPWLKDGRLLHIMLEHELMHQETLLYMVHQLPAAFKQPRAPHGPRDASPPQAHPGGGAVTVPEGFARLGARPVDGPFVWDNELPGHDVRVPAFRIDATLCTNRQYMAFLEAGGYQHSEFWDAPAWDWLSHERITHPRFWQPRDSGWTYRDLFAEIPLPPDWPVMVTQAEATAYARFMGKRLPTEAEWHRAAFGDDPERPYPWGWEPPSAQHGNFDFQRCGPAPVGSFPQGASSLGVLDLLGNGWEWTCTPFGPFEGFQADPSYPGYSADFFDGKHMVLKGGSWATDAKLLRASFRNWFYATYPYAYATFRCVAPA